MTIESQTITLYTYKCNRCGTRVERRSAPPVLRLGDKIEIRFCEPCRLEFSAWMNAGRHIEVAS